MVYAYLADGRDEAQMRELDMLLAPPDKKEELQAQANMEAMKRLSGQMAGMQVGRR